MLNSVKILVLDEVDHMLDMGFKPAIRRIAAALPQDRQTLCSSASFSPAIRQGKCRPAGAKFLMPMSHESPSAHNCRRLYRSQLLPNVGIAPEILLEQ